MEGQAVFAEGGLRRAAAVWRGAWYILGFLVLLLAPGARTVGAPFPPVNLPPGSVLEPAKPAPAISLSPSKIDFSSVRVGATSSPRTLKITNTGNVPVDVSLSARTPDDPSIEFYPQTERKISQMAVGASWTVSYFFRPGISGLRSAQLHVLFDYISPGHTILDGRVFNVTGTGLALKVSPTRLDLGRVPVGSQTTANISVTNQAAVSLNPKFSLFAFSDTDFRHTRTGDGVSQLNSAAASLAPGQTTRVGFSFAPAKPGRLHLQIIVVTSENVLALSRPVDVVQVVITAEAVAPPPLRVSPTQLPFGSVAVGGTSLPRDLTLTNAGATPLMVQEASLSGTDAARFQRMGSTGPLTLAAGGTAKLQFTFTPTALGRQTASLELRYQGGDFPLHVQLTGTGTTPGAITTGDWPVFMQNPGQLGRAAAAPTLASLTPWSLPIGSKPGLSPVLFGGVAYLGSEAHGLFAFDLATRAQKWNHPFPAPVRAAAAAGPDAIVVSGTALVGLSPKDGSQLWQRPDIVSADPVAPMLAGDTIYIGGAGPGGFGGAMFAVKVGTGANVWASPPLLPALPLSTAAVDPVAGRLYAAVGMPGQGSSAIMALQTRDGATAWPAPVVLPVPAPAGLSLGSVGPVGKEQPALFVAAGNRVIALNAASGAALWTHPLPETALQSPPAVRAGAGGTTLFVAGTSGKVYALSGETGAEVSGGLASPIAPAVGAPALAGSLVFLPTKSGLLALDTSTGQVVWQGEVEAATAVAVSGSELCVGSSDGRFVAFHGTPDADTVDPTPDTSESGDLAVVQIQVQPVVFRTAGAVVRVVIANRGNASSPYRLSLRADPPNKTIKEVEGTLAAGATATVMFNWPASLMEEGGALLVAEVWAPDRTDAHEEDNSASQFVTIDQ
jgi:outer membrane protein assembly factor BamB